MVAPLLGMLVSSAAIRTAFGGSGTLASSLKMGLGYTTGSYVGYGTWNNDWLDPLNVGSRWDMRGGPLKSKLPFRKSKKMAFGYRRYRRYRPYRRRRYYRSYRRYY